MIYIKVLLSFLAIIGVLINLGRLIGRLKDKDRLGFLMQIESDLECDKRHPGATKFIEDFVFKRSSQDRNAISFVEIDKVFFTGTWHGHSDPQLGRQVTSIVAGDIKVRSVTGDPSIPLCSYEDLKKWANDSKFWKWLGWSLVATSALLGAVLLVFESYDSV